MPKLVERADFRPEAVRAFVCGPEVMIHFTVEALRGRGVPDERIFLSLERDMRCGVGLCGHCHDLKTRYGWSLVHGTGKRPMVPPDDPRHPKNKPK